MLGLMAVLTNRLALLPVLEAQFVKCTWADAVVAADAAIRASSAIVRCSRDVFDNMVLVVCARRWACRPLRRPRGLVASLSGALRAAARVWVKADRLHTPSKWYRTLGVPC